MNPKHLLVPVLVLAAGAGLGFTLGSWWRQQPAQPSPTTALAGLDRSASGRAGKRGGSSAPTRGWDDSPLATRLEHDLSMSSGVTRWLFWLETLEKATPADCPRLVRLARDRPELLRMIATRWAELDPQHFLNTLTSPGQEGLPFSALSNTLIREWAKSDPTAAINALDHLPETVHRQELRMSLTVAVIEKNVEQGLQALSQWGIDNYGPPDMRSLAKWAAADPRHAAEFTLAHPAGHATQMALEAIGKEWARTDPAEAMAFATGHPGEGKEVMARSVMKDWASHHLSQATAWLAKADRPTQTRLIPSLVETWAAQDPHSALAWCGAQLSGNLLTQAVGSVFKGMAEKDWAAAAQLVSSLEPSPARGKGAVEVAEKAMPDYNSKQPPSPEVVAWISSLDPDTLKQVIDSIHWRWSEVDPRGFGVFLAKTANDEIPAHYFTSQAERLATRNPLEALQWVETLPENRRVEAGGSAYSEWLQTQPEAARKWLQDLPAKDSRRTSFFEVALSRMVQGVQAEERLAALNEQERATARRLMEKMPLPKEDLARYLKALR